MKGISISQNKIEQVVNKIWEKKQGGVYLTCSGIKIFFHFTDQSLPEHDSQIPDNVEVTIELPELLQKKKRCLVFNVIFCPINNLLITIIVLTESNDS